MEGQLLFRDDTVSVKDIKESHIIWKEVWEKKLEIFVAKNKVMRGCGNRGVEIVMNGKILEQMVKTLLLLQKSSWRHG